MSVTERLQKPGQFAVKLKANAPSSALAAVALFDHIVITPTRLLPIGGYSDANILAQAIYTGVVTGEPDVDQIVGQGLGFWLGTDDGLGDILDTRVSNTAGTLSTWVTSLKPSSLSAGTVTNTGTTLTYQYQYVTRREALDHACRAMGAEWRIDSDFTLDAAAPATLHTNYTTPKAVITRKPEGSEGTTTGIMATDIVRATDIDGYTTKVYVIGKTGDEAPFAVGTATGANVYKDGLNNNVVMERLVNAPTEPSANVTAYAASVLALYSASRQAIRLSSDTYAASLRVKPGERVYVYDQRAGLVDTANQITWRGELITPVLLRCLALTWPIARGMGVYARRSGATPTYTDLSDWVEFEDSATVWQVGTSDADANQDPTQLASAYLGVNADIAARSSLVGQMSRAVLAADVVNSTTAYADVTGLSFPVKNGRNYWFRFIITYDAAATTTGSAWGINGPTVTSLRARSEYSLTTTTTTRNEGVVFYDTPAGANATSATTAGNRCEITGFITPSADGNVIARFLSEVAASAITAKATYSFVEWAEI